MFGFIVQPLRLLRSLTELSIDCTSTEIVAGMGHERWPLPLLQKYDCRVLLAGLEEATGLREIRTRAGVDIEAALVKVSRRRTTSTCFQLFCFPCFSAGGRDSNRWTSRKATRFRAPPSSFWMAFTRTGRSCTLCGSS